MNNDNQVDLKLFRTKKCTRYVSEGKRGVRRVSGISKTELARRVGVSARTIHRWENDPITQPKNTKSILFDVFMKYEDSLTTYKKRGKGIVELRMGEG